MDTNTVEIKPFILALTAILAIEVAGRIIFFRYRFNAVALIGAVRLSEIMFMGAIIKRFGKGLENVGMQPSGILKGLRKGLVWSACFGAGVAVIFIALHFIGVDPFTLFTVAMPSNVTSIILLFFVACFIGPLAEEFFFRGLLYGFLRRWGIFNAVILSTLVFVLIHSATTGFPFPQIVGGIIFAAAYEAEKNLMVPITIHVLGNTAIYSLSLFP